MANDGEAAGASVNGSEADGLLTIIEQITDADVRAILNQVQNGTPLTVAQRQRLDEYTAQHNSGGTVTVSGEPAPEFADSVTALAAALSCDRKTIQRYLKIEGNPGADADERYNITAWRTWAEEHNRLKRKRPKEETRIDAELRGIQLRNEKLAIENKVRLGQLADIDEVSKVLGDLVAGLVSAARGMKHHLAPQVVGCEIGEATKRIGKEVEDVLNRLAMGEWAKDVKKKPFWSRVYAVLSDLRRKYSLGGGLSATS